ncbi:MAG: DUF58 domain-containing protein [Planctomycetes bacterium]|nr:DUF58 domain-containing protein [Planctomycetota bacterium]
MIDQSFLSKIGKLDLVSRKILQGKIKGEKRSKKRGQSVEFADHRLYTPGDDLRFLDWNIYARLDKLMIKLFLEEEDLRVYLLVDSSKSMDYGRPNKLRYALKVAAALGYIGLVNNNRVGIGTFSTQLDRVFRPERGRRNLPKMIKFLEETVPEGRTDLGRACKRFAQEHRAKGVVILISDFLDRHGYEDAVRFFVARKMDVFCLQILAPQELDPPLTGDLKLVDSEDGQETEITISGPLLERYKANLAALMGGLREFCHKRGARYLSSSTALPFERLVLDQLRLHGVLR